MVGVSRNKKIGRAALLLGVLALVAYGFWTQLRSWQRTAIAVTSWRVGGTADAVAITVQDGAWQPLKGARVNVLNNSGDNEGVTDDRGYIVIRDLGESDFMGLDLNGVRVVSRPLAPFLFFPNVDQGLQVSVEIQDRSAIERHERSPLTASE